MKHVRVRAAIGMAALATMALGGAGSAQAAGDLHCQASTARIDAIGLPQTLEPVTAGGTGRCANDSVAPLSSLPGALEVHALADTTYDAPTNSGTATGGLVSMKVLTPGDLLSQLPTNAKIADLPLIPVTLLAPIPLVGSVVQLDVRKAVEEYLKPLQPAAGMALLETGVLQAHAAVACRSGEVSLSGNSDLANVAIAGTELPIGDGLHQMVDIIGAQSIPLKMLSVDDLTILDSLGNPIPAPLASTVKTAVAALLPTLTQAVPTLPATTLDVTLTPGGQTRVGDALTQRALIAKVVLGGIHLLDATIGEATVSADAGACALPVKQGPPPPDKPADEGGVEGVTANGSVADQILACSDRRLVLVDVLRQGNMVKLLGAANRDYAGKTVAIRLRATHRVVAHATVQKDGSFQTTAPLPPKRFRTAATRNLVRYSAEIGKERSLPLKLERRMIVSGMSSKDGKVTIAGRVVGPLTRPATTVRLMRRVNCKEQALVATFKPRSDGRFTVTVDAPAGQVAAVYRMTTQVRANRHSAKRFPTFTLPRGVALDSR